MKCKECNSCLRVIRIDYPEISKVYWYCDFCNSAFPLSGGAFETDKNILKDIEERYKSLYGDKQGI